MVFETRNVAAKKAATKMVTKPLGSKQPRNTPVIESVHASSSHSRAGKAHQEKKGKSKKTQVRAPSRHSVGTNTSLVKDMIKGLLAGYNKMMALLSATGVQAEEIPEAVDQELFAAVLGEYPEPTMQKTHREGEEEEEEEEEDEEEAYSSKKKKSTYLPGGRPGPRAESAI